MNSASFVKKFFKHRANYIFAPFVLLCLTYSSLSFGEHSPKIISSHSISEDRLTLSYIRAIFSMRIRTWPDGTPIKVFVLPHNSAAHTAFCKQRLKIYPYVLKDQWERVMYSGTGGQATVVESEQQMQRQVSETKGAIGYIFHSQLAEPNLIILNTEKPSGAATTPNSALAMKTAGDLALSGIQND